MSILRDFVSRAAGCALVAFCLGARMGGAQALPESLDDGGVPLELAADVPPTHDVTVGTLAGSASTEGGAATYRIPIVVPPGRAGMEPSLALSYSSRGGDGVMGMGWSISGSSSIHRCPQTPEQDGVTKGVSYTGSDRLCLDGQRLVRMGSGAYGAANTTYATEVDSYSRVTQIGGDLAGTAACFKVEEKSGRVLHYGAVVSGTACTGAAARVQPGGAAASLSWLLVKVEDRAGNNQQYAYDASAGNGEVLLSRIDYTGFGGAAGDRSVNFSYVTRTQAASAASDVASSYLAGGLTMQTKALSEIRTKVGAATVRTITPGYVASAYSGRLMVRTLEECAYAGATPFCHPKTQFTTSVEGAAPAASGFHLSSLSALNLPQAQRETAPSAEEAAAFETRSAERAFVDPQTDATAGIVQVAQLIGDLDGDGTREMALGIEQGTGQNASQHDYLVQLTADRQVRSAVELPGLLCYGGDCYGDFAGDGRSDLVLMPRTTSDPAFVRLGLWNLARGAVATPGSQPISVFQSNIPAPNGGSAASPAWAAPHVVDVNGDGRLDLVIEQPLGCGNDTVGNPKYGVYAYVNVSTLNPTTHTFDAQHPPTFTLPAQPLFCLGRTVTSQSQQTFAEHIDHIADFNGDGLPDFFVTDSFPALSSPSLTQVRLTQVAGGVPTVGAALSCASIGLVNSAGADDECRWSNGYAVRWMDVNGDGLDDFVIARPSASQGAWQVRFNTGGQFGAPITTTGTGSTAGLDSYPTPISGQPARRSFRYASRVPGMDVDGDGKGDLLVVSA